MDNMVEFAHKLKMHREKAGLTQAQLAKMIGVTSQTISAYEKNSQEEKGKTPTLDKAVSLAQALGVSLNYLCGLNVSDKDCSMETLRDIAECLTNIASYIPCYGSTRVRRLTDEEYQAENCGLPEEYAVETTDMAVLTLDNSSLANFFKTKNKLLELYQDGTLDRETFDSIIEGQLSRLQNYKINRKTSWIPGGIKTEQDIP